jgi:hypothetical protein
MTAASGRQRRMQDYAAEDIVIGVIASLGVLVLIVVFVLVFRQVIKK